MTDQTDKERRQTKPFAAFLQEHRDGALHGKASDALADVVAAVQEHGKQGKLTIQIVVSPTKYDNAVEIVGNVKPVLPEAAPPAAMWYSDDEGNVSRRDPRQMSIDDVPIRAVATIDSTKEIVEVDGETGEIAAVIG